MKSASAALTPSVTTTDLLKFLGVVFLLVDHWGLFFDPDENLWRLFGRIAAPIFFFLIGFARSRNVPWTWLAFGALLTATGAWIGGIGDTTLNILLNFALLRFAILPAVEAYAMHRPWAVVLLILACLPLIDPTDGVLEYGTEGWLWAFFGLAHRLASEENTRFASYRLWGIALVTVAAYVAREIHDYEFDALQAMLLGPMIVALALALLRFRRASLTPQPPEPLAGIVRLCGRYSLEIYAISLFAMQVSSYALGITGGAETSDGSDEEAS